MTARFEATWSALTEAKHHVRVRIHMQDDNTPHRQKITQDLNMFTYNTKTQNKYKQGYAVRKD